MNKIMLIVVSLAMLAPRIEAKGPSEFFKLRNGLPNARLVFERTKKGRVVFLGGSITRMKGWTSMVAAELQRRFPDTKFDFINAGIPSTGSTPGAFRLARDVFKNGPVDLLFEEAAVNDLYNGRSDTEQVRGMEGIVRHARKLNANIDIVIMHFVDPPKMADYNSGKTPQVIRNHEKVAAHYKVPSIDLAREVTERINRKEFAWKRFGGLHPAKFGHELYSKAIARMFDAAWPGKTATGKITAHRQPEKLDKFCYDAGQLLKPNKAEKLKGFKHVPKWKNTVGGRTRNGFVDVPMLVASQPGDSFELSFKGSAIGLFVAAGPDAGIIEYRIDGGKWITRDLFTKWSSGLHIPWLYLLDGELDPKKTHRIEVRISSKKNAMSKGHACRIVNFAINAN
ncbi:MAG: SGNH/GDSL hydrolase family protein [bacterium]|nr:SGNH/GDSL hydrolase family protein [bacterium]